MKRIVAKEFLLLVGCVMVVLLVALFGWGRNEWLNHRITGLVRGHSEQAKLLDSLIQQSTPIKHDFIDLFDSAFVTKNCEVFLVTPFWTNDPFLTGQFESTKSPFDPSKPFTVVQSTFNRRLLLCVANALEKNQYLTPERVHTLASRCSWTTYDDPKWLRSLDKAASKAGRGWKPSPFESEEMYMYNPPINNDGRTWNDIMESKGVTPAIIDTVLVRHHNDSSGSPRLLVLVRGILCDTVPFEELRHAFEYLKERSVLQCGFEDLLSTLQDKPVPPTQEALAAVAHQRAIVNKLREEQNDARASLWGAAKQGDMVKWAAIVLLVLFYPLRLLVLGTRWALRTLWA